MEMKHFKETKAYGKTGEIGEVIGKWVLIFIVFIAYYIIWILFKWGKFCFNMTFKLMEKMKQNSKKPKKVKNE